jgi:iron(III) transport system permease protein
LSLEDKPGSPILQISAVLALGVVAIPIFYLLQRSLSSESSVFAEILLRPKTLEILLTSISLTLSVSILATVLGVLIAWSLHFLPLPGAGYLRALAILPMAIPSYVLTYSWLSLELFTGGFLPALMILTLSTTPFIILAALAAFRRIDNSQHDVALTLGLNQFQSFRRVILPQIQGSLTASSLLVALYVLSDFGAVSLLGVDTFTRAIQNTYQGAFDRSAAAILALVLVLISSAIIAVEVRSRKVPQLNKSSASNFKSSQIIRSPKLLTLALVLISTYLILALFAPMGILLARFINRPEAIDIQSLSGATLATILVAGIGAILAIALAMPVALVAARGFKLGKFAERGLLVVHALPGIVMGLALVSFGSDLPWLYQTLGLLGIAYSILFMAKAVGSIRTAVSRVPTNLIEISSTLGKSRRQTFTAVVLPLAAPNVLTGTLLVFLAAMKELPATLMLRPTGFDTLATEMWTYTSIFRFSEAAPYALLLVIVAAIPTFLITRPDRESNEGGEIS